MPDPLAKGFVNNPFGGRNSILTVATSPEAAHRAEAQTFPLKNAINQKTKTMNKQTQATSNDMGTLAEDARALMAATADVAGEKVGEARKRLAAALERARRSMAASARRRSKAPRRPTRPCMSILIKPSPSASGSARRSELCRPPLRTQPRLIPIWKNPPSASGAWRAPRKQLAKRLATIGENRLELLTVELQEERQHLRDSILMAFGVTAFGLLAALTLSAAIVVLLWAWSPIACPPTVDRLLCPRPPRSPCGGN